MVDDGPACFLLGLEPLDPRLQFRDPAVFGLHRQAGDVPAFGDALSSEFVFVQELYQLLLDGRRDVDGGFQDPERVSGEC